MSRLTWRDTAQPNFGSSVSDMTRANMLLQSSLGGLSDSLGKFGEHKKAAELEQQNLADNMLRAGFLERAGDAQGTQEYARSLGSILAQNPRMASGEFIQQALSNNGTAIAQNQGRQNLDHTGYKNDREVADNSAQDAYRSIQAQILDAQQRGDVAGGELLQNRSLDLLGNMSLEAQRQAVAGGTSERNNRTSNTNAIEGNTRAWEANRRAWNQEGRAQVNHNNALTDRAEARTAEEIWAEARKFHFDPVQQDAFITQNSPNGIVMNRAINTASVSPTLGERGQQAGGRGQGTSGAQGGNSMSTELPQYTDGAGIAEKVLRDQIGTRGAQAGAISSAPNLASLERSELRLNDVVNELVDEKGGMFAGAEKGAIITQINKLKAENPGMNDAQAGYLLANSTREQNLIEKYVPNAIRQGWKMNPLMMAWNGGIPDDDLRADGGIALDSGRLQSTASQYNSPQYMQDREAQYEFQAASQNLDTADARRDQVKQLRQRAERQALITGGEFDPKPFDAMLEAIQAERQGVYAVTGSDKRLQPWVRGENGETSTGIEELGKAEAARYQREAPQRKVAELNSQLSALEAERQLVGATGNRSKVKVLSQQIEEVRQELRKAEAKLR